MSRQTILETELALPAYSALTDQQRYDSLMLEDIPSKRSIPTHNIQIYLEFIDKLYTIRTHAADAAQHVTMVFDQFEAFDMSDSDQATVLNRILQSVVDAGIILQSDMDTIIAYGDIIISRATELGLNNLLIGEVIDARI